MHRKTVSVVFCDLVGSTALGEQLDPEALRTLLVRYFDRMRAILEAHGGTVEKFAGDAVMAVFGVPVAHEDDALRACRAAAAMRDAIPALGLEGRIGVNTGEVVAGGDEWLAAGDAVNVAARFQQVAAPGEVLLGEATLALAGSALETEPVEPLSLKGKSAAVRAFRLVSVRPSPEREHGSRFVGRAAEVALVRQAWARAAAARRCELVTVAGDAGIGKSRLAVEALASAGARMVRGRCLPYGDGITYWPVVEIVRELDALPSEPAAAAALRSLLGESDEGASAAEIAWAFRKLLEQQAPLVCVFDDVQWAEETLLDLVERVAALSTDAPILLLCLARPELAERRPDWRMTLRLEPLPPEAVDELIVDGLLPELRRRIAQAAGGNPLFVTEMLALAEGAERIEVPPTLKALLAARLDQLDPRERRVLERGAVEGESFHRGAVEALAAGEPQVEDRLASLVRRGVITVERDPLLGEDAFRFRHLLLRDAAYDSLPKAVRADLHERFAGWLDEHADSLAEHDEVAGYHLEAAARYRAEIGEADPAVADRAARRLAAAGRRALLRGDRRAAANLLERALQLGRPLRLDVQLELDLADALAHDPPRARVIAETAAAAAAAAGDEPAAALARAVAAARSLDLKVMPVGAVEATALAALPLLEREGDHAGLVQLWGILGGIANYRGRWDDWASAGREALRHSRLAGRREPGAWGQGGLMMGSRPADDALDEVDRLLGERPRTLLLLLGRSWLLAMLDRFDEAWPIAYEAAARARDQATYPGEIWLAEIASLAGSHCDAARWFRTACDTLEERGQLAYLSTHAPQLGRELCALGRYDEAEPLARRGRELGDEQDVTAQAFSRQVQALVLAHRGDHGTAERLAREALSITEQTDGLNFQGAALGDLAQVLHAAGRDDEAAAALAGALDRYERKRNLAMARRVREQLAALQVA